MKLTSHRVVASCASIGTLLFAALPAAAQNQHWIRQFGTSFTELGIAAGPDGSGGVCVGGYTGGSLFGPGAGSWDAWFARYDAAGIQLWGRQLGTAGWDQVNAAGADGAGGLFVGGFTYGSLGGPSAGSADAWLARYDLAGNQLWLRQLGTIAEDQLRACTEDGSGGVFLCGWTGFSLGGTSAGSYDAWLARYDGAGNQLWVRQLGTSGLDYAYGIARDASGGVYVTGITAGSLGGPFAGGMYDAWLARYDGAGNQLWIRKLGSSGSDSSFAAAADGSGGVYMVGETGGSLGGQFFGANDAWLARYDSAGNQLWVRQLGSSQGESANGASPDGSGGVFLGGYTAGILGGTSAGNWDAWLARYDGAGNQLWVRQFGSSGFDDPFAMAADGAGAAYLVGYTNGNIGGSSAGGDDIWLARYGPSLPLLCEPGLAGVIACPCSNPASGPGRGCDNSSTTGGANLTAAGDAQLSADTLEFTAQDEKPTALSVLLQGTSEISAGVIFGQGVRCVGGTLRRLYVHAAVGGAVTMPSVLLGDSSISARSAALGDVIPPGQSRWYSVYYRDPLVLGACPAASTFNTGPTMRAVWAP